MKKRITQQITRKHINGSNIYKVVDLIDGAIANIRAVRQVGDEFTYALELSLAEREYMDSDLIFEIEEGPEFNKALEVVKTYEKNIEENIKTILSVTALVDTESIQVRTIAGHTYVLTKNLDKEIVPMIQYVYGDSDGRIFYHGPLPNDSAIHGIIQLDLIKNPFEIHEKYPEEQLYQIGGNEYGVIAKHGDIFVTIPIMLQEEEDGEISWTTNADYYRFIDTNEQGDFIFIDKPEDVFPTLSDAHAYLGEITKNATERVVMKN